MRRVFIILCLILFSAGAHAGKRIALVVGNDSYRNVPTLKNARADARAVADALKSAGFDVTLRTDVSDKAFREILRGFKARVEGGDEAVFYFSGHGVQIGAANYLLPIDIASDSEEQVKDDALPLQRVLDDLQDQKARFSLAIVDACRDNPFKGRGRNIGGRGLQPVNPATGQMVLYSAGAGQQALDRLSEHDRDPNGLFTRILLKEMNRPGLSVDRMLRNVRSQVVTLAKNAHHDQVPALYDQAIGEFYFKPGRASEAEPERADAPAPRPPRATPTQASDDPVEAAYWAEVRRGDDADSYAAYLSTYPNGLHVADANEYLERDKQAKAAKEKLKEDQAWQKAQSGESYASYSAYLKSYPAGRYAKLAELKQSKLRPARAPFEPEMVTIPGRDYAMGKTEVTQVQWRAVMGGDPPKLKFKGCDDCPVENVSWDDVQGYLSKLNQMSGKQYRLPTEQEWKHACDGGSSQEYCGDNDLDAVGWYDGNSGGKTHPVGQKQANGYGLYDMSGNVWEWMQDCWFGECSMRALRGGSWDLDSEVARAAYRYSFTSALRHFNNGFRVVVRSARAD